MTWEAFKQSVLELEVDEEVTGTFDHEITNTQVEQFQTYLETQKNKSVTFSPSSGKKITAKRIS